MAEGDAESEGEDLEAIIADAERVLYPCTITPTRYSGIYEGGRWAAMRLSPEHLPDSAFGGDPEAYEWWVGAEAAWVGVGGSPNQAFRDLVQRWARLGCRTCHGIGMVPGHEGYGWRFCDSCGGEGRDSESRCGYCGQPIDAWKLADHLRFCAARNAIIQERYPARHRP